MGTGTRSKSEIPAKMSGRSCNRKVWKNRAVMLREAKHLHLSS
jgi:hypothetical protein